MNQVGHILDRSVTDATKGIFLILMYILHFFCFPTWYVSGISYPSLQWMEGLQGHFQICIAGFTFLTGYFYYSSQKGTLRYVLKKWVDILIPFWIVLGILLIIGKIIGTENSLSIDMLVLNFLGFKSSIMPFGWYVAYYLIMIPTLVFTVKWIKNDLLLMVVGLLMPMVAYYGLAHYLHENVIVSILAKYQVYFPITIIGFLSAKHCLFGKMDELLEKSVVKILVSIAMVVVVFMEPSWLYGISINNIAFEMARKILRILSIPFFVYGIVTLLKMLPPRIHLPFTQIGKYSTIMWFTHGVFFGGCKELFQPILYMPTMPVIVLLWGLSINFIVSVPIRYIARKIRTRVKV